MRVVEGALAETRLIVTDSQKNGWELREDQLQRLDELGELLLRRGRESEQDAFQALICLPIAERRRADNSRYTLAPEGSPQFLAYSALYTGFWRGRSQAEGVPLGEREEEKEERLISVPTRPYTR